MKQEHVVVIAAVSAGAGAVARGMGLTTGNAIFDAILGFVVAAIGYKTKMEYVSDIMEGGGIGFVLDAVL
jgi:hypothetical protein